MGLCVEYSILLGQFFENVLPALGPDQEGFLDFLAGQDEFLVHMTDLDDDDDTSPHEIFNAGAETAFVFLVRDSFKGVIFRGDTLVRNNPLSVYITAESEQKAIELAALYLRRFMIEQGIRT